MFFSILGVVNGQPCTPRTCKVVLKCIGILNIRERLGVYTLGGEFGLTLSHLLGGKKIYYVCNLMLT